MNQVRALARRVAGWPDLPVAAVVVLALAAPAEVHFAWFGYGDVDTGVVLNICATAPLLLARRLLPLAAVIIGGAVCALLSMYDTLPLTGLAGQLVVLYLVAARYPRWASGLALLPLAGNVVYPYSGDPEARPAGLVLLGAGVAATWVGDARRQRRLLLAEHDTTRQEMVEARHDQAVLAERSRIARELHDVVAHHVSMMVVQAESARVSTEGLPPAGRESLAAIGVTGRQALTEMRRLIGVLRTDRAEPPALAPQPGLDRLDELVAAAGEAGGDVRLVRHGTVRPLPAGVDLTAYRIIQEALTNVRRHAPGATAAVDVQYGERSVRIAVVNDSPARPDPGAGGHGLLGMRERASMVGGTIHIGPMPEGGFRVEVELPIEEGR